MSPVHIGLVALYVGGLLAIGGMMTATWSDPPSKQSTHDKMAGLHPAVAFAVVAFMMTFWPFLVVWLFMRTKEEREE